MICPKYIALYLTWAAADEFEREAALEKLKVHHFYCHTCQERHKTDTEQAKIAVHPEIEAEPA